MNIICSISGIDGTGKTTQIEKLKENYPDYIEVIGGLEKYEKFPKLEPQLLHNWWFSESSPNDFCDVMYSCIAERNEEIKKCNKRIVIVDKGWINFDVRIKATLRVKGLSEIESDNLIIDYKKKYNIEDIEDLKFCIISKEFNQKKMNDDNYDVSKQNTYKEYSKLQREYINECVNMKKFDEVLVFEDGIETIFQKIKKHLLDKYIQKINLSEIKISLLEEMQYIGNSINYINYSSIKYLFNTLDDFKNINKLFDIIEERKMNNIQIYNYKIEKQVSIHNFNKLNNYKRDMLPFVTSETYEIKQIEDFKIPDNYKKILLDVFLSINNEFGEKINLFLVHGSAGRECMHEGWSDLDIILVFEKYNFDEIIKLGKFIEKYNIKVGTTVYSKYEAESLLVDAKTLYSLYLMQKEEIGPSIFKNLKIPEIRYEDLVLKNMQVLPEAIHKLKRLLYTDKIDAKSIVKTLNLIMKVILINDGIFPKAYEEVFQTFAYRYGVEHFEIGKHLNEESEGEKIKEYAKYVIENVVNA